jgi:hypothetical protein
MNHVARKRRRLRALERIKMNTFEQSRARRLRGSAPETEQLWQENNKIAVAALERKLGAQHVASS